MSHIPLIQEIYGAMATGDVETLMSHFSDDIELDVWDPPSPAQDVLSFTRPHRGKAAMLAAQADLANVIEVHSVEPVNFLEGGQQVAVALRVDATARATGNRYQDYEFHLWTIGSDGKVVALRHVIDTYKQVLAYQPSA